MTLQRRSFVYAGLIWTLLIGGSLGWNVKLAEQQMMDMVYAEARANLNKDISFRRWATEHGGIYVPLTETQHAVPWLAHLPDRDVTTTDGRKLTLLNPATMLQQVMQRYAKEYGIQGRITALKYLNPANAPDSWEKQQLEMFAPNGKNEVWAQTEIKGQPHLRYLRAMFMEPGCDKCHGVLGYKQGDIRGATGVNIPLAPYLAQFNKSWWNMGLSHFAIWLIGLCGIYFSIRGIIRREKKILDINQNLEKTIQQRTIELQNSLSNLHIKDAAIASSINAIAIIEQDGKISYVNQAFVKLWKLTSSEQALQHQLTEFLGERTQDINNKLQQQGQWQGELQISSPQGSTLELYLSANQIQKEQGFPACVLASFVDISHQKHVERELIEAKQAAEVASRTKSEFLANMSHEIRTPMNAILGLTQLVLESGLPEHQQNFLKKAHTSARALLGILNDILDYSKIEAGQMTIERAPFKLDDVLSHISDLFSASIEEKGLNFYIECNPNLPTVIIGDSLRLTQVLTNLISNAVKFTEHGEIYLQLEIEQNHGNDYTLCFTVQDTGIGLNHQQVERLFQSFSQGDDSTTRKYGGTGLGLSISQRLVNLMGGQISVFSKEKQGSTFIFTIQTCTPKDLHNSDKPPLRGLHTLIVDYHENARRILQRYLESWGEQTQTASSGEDALNKIKAAQQNYPFDLIIIDWRMPDMDGLTTLREIEQYHARGLINPLRAVIMVSAHERMRLQQGIGTLEIHGIINKPIIPQQLLTTLVECHYPQTLSRQKSNQQSLKRNLQGMRILLVEDNKTNRIMASELLERRGVLLSIACDGSEAIQRVKQQTFDAILMDMHMPIMDGLEATRLICNMQLTPKPIIIAMTAAVLQEDVAHCYEAGMVDFIAKPIDPELLVSTLLKWVKPRASSHKNDSTPVEIKDAFLPHHLPEFDLDVALRRLDGNRGLLAKLLLGFVQDNNQTIQQLEEMIASNDFRLAATKLHTLQGVAANLGATKLYEVAKRWEKQLKTGHNHADEQVEFCQQLSAALNSIRDHVTTLDNDNLVTHVDPTHMLQILQQLQPYLQQHELIPDELMKALYQLVRADKDTSILAQLIRQIDDFNCHAALQSLNELISNYESKLTNN